MICVSSTEIGLERMLSRQFASRSATFQLTMIIERSGMGFRIVQSNPAILPVIYIFQHTSITFRRDDGGIAIVEGTWSMNAKKWVITAAVVSAVGIGAV